MSPTITPTNSYARYLAPPTLRPAPDHVRNLLPDYEITHILGSGGYAKVYKALGPKGKEIALKVPRTDDIFTTMDMEVINRFKSEADLWMRLEHPNIVTLHSGKTKPLPHMAMELMVGGNLKHLMKNHTLKVGEAIHIMDQVLKGLSFAHRMASVHRDLKPENILFTADGVAKITDWGIGKFMASVGKSQSVGIKGTLDYCAPEQYDRREYGKVDWQTDIFQTGVMFYEMLTGENPFAGEDFADCMGKVLRYNPEPPSRLNRNIPPELDEIIMGALEKDKKKRWDSGAVMLNELKRVIGGRKIIISQPQKIDRGPEIPKPKPKGNVCPECGNIIALENKKLRCKACKNYFCETCESWINKVTAYRGYKVKTDYPLCEDCYDEAVDSGKKRIDTYIKKTEKPKELANSIVMKFVPIPGKDYYMGKYTVTQKEWKAVMGSTPWRLERYTKEGADYPAAYISWNDCQQFVKKLNSKEGRNRYRLPTEEEWEHACRAGSTTKYCFGDDASRLAEYAWYNDMDNDRYGDNPKKVGQKKPNKWGLYDMHGNVWEWTSTAEGSYRVNRGGSWYNLAELCESSDRYGGEPNYRSYGLGVRLVRSSD